MPIQPQEIYKRFLLKINKNDTNSNIKVSAGVFIIFFNEEKRKYLDSQLGLKESTDEIDTFEEILKLDVPLDFIAASSTKVDFKLPDDFFKRTIGYCVCTKDSCIDIPVVVWFKKIKDLDVLLRNSDTNPSFEYHETLGIINNGKVSIYKTDFTVNKMYLSYYMEPTDIDIEGYEHVDGTASKNITTELSLQNIEKIIDRTVVEVAQNYEDINKMQMAFQRQQINER